MTFSRNILTYHNYIFWKKDFRLFQGNISCSADKVSVLWVNGYMGTYSDVKTTQFQVLFQVPLTPYPINPLVADCPPLFATTLSQPNTHSLFCGQKNKLEIAWREAPLNANNNRASSCQ